MEWIKMAQVSVERKIKVDNESRREEKETRIKINKEIQIKYMGTIAVIS